MRHTAMASLAVMLLWTVPASAKNWNDLHVGQVTCIDVLGPFNKIGTIIEKNGASQKILLRTAKGKVKWYPAKKTRNVTACKVVGKLAKELLKEAVERAAAN